MKLLNKYTYNLFKETKKESEKLNIFQQMPPRYPDKIRKEMWTQYKTDNATPL